VKKVTGACVSNAFYMLFLVIRSALKSFLICKWTELAALSHIKHRTSRGKAVLNWELYMNTEVTDKIKVSTEAIFLL
jgi:hypothetical protein